MTYTDEEIIKALECCVSEKDTCKNCPFQELKHYDYENEMFEIMPNGKQYDDWSCERWLNVAVLELINRQQAEIERLNKLVIEKHKKNNELHEYLQYAKSEAVKEFAERLRSRIIDDFLGYKTDATISYIDNLLKEMLGEDEI